jgi:hypothetical protein
MLKSGSPNILDLTASACGHWKTEEKELLQSKLAAMLNSQQPQAFLIKIQFCRQISHPRHNRCYLREQDP